MGGIMLRRIHGKRKYESQLISQPFSLKQTFKFREGGKDLSIETLDSAPTLWSSRL
jgi:hypothetical protein